MTQAGDDSSEFRIPDSELGGSVEFRVPSPESPRLQPVPSDMILLSRRTLHLEAALLAVVAVLGFVAGYLIGSGRPGNSTAGDDLARNRVPVEGTVTYESSDSAPRGDKGAVVILLPAEENLPAALPVDGLRPGDPASARAAAVKSLQQAGGAATLADGAGMFTLFAPVKGKYQVLVISANAERPSGQPIDSAAAASVGRYFASADALLGRARFEWTVADVSLASKALSIHFKP